MDELVCISEVQVPETLTPERITVKVQILTGISVSRLSTQQMSSLSFVWENANKRPMTVSC